MKNLVVHPHLFWLVGSYDGRFWKGLGKVPGGRTPLFRAWRDRGNPFLLHPADSLIMAAGFVPPAIYSMVWNSQAGRTGTNVAASIRNGGCRAHALVCQAQLQMSQAGVCS